MTPPVVGVLVDEPVALHVAGVEVGHVETIHEVGAVVCQLHHLTYHVEMLVEPHPEVAAVLQRAGRSEGYISTKVTIFHTSLRILNLNKKIMMPLKSKYCLIIF